MQSRSLHGLVPPRGLARLTAVCAAVGALNCASPAVGAGRTGSLSGALSAPMPATRGRARATREDILAWGTGTYINRILIDRDSVLDRWPNRVAEPINVWIDVVPGDPGDSPQQGFVAAVRDAFDEWADAGIPLRFRYVDSPRGAEVRVRWVNLLENKTGSTTWRANRDGWLRDSEITLATHVSSGRPLDTAGVRAIALHEIGHMIGLSHSVDGHDIMAPLVRVGGLSVADRATARLLYTFAAGRVGR